MALHSISLMFVMTCWRWPFKIPFSLLKTFLSLFKDPWTLTNTSNSHWKNHSVKSWRRDELQVLKQNLGNGKQLDFWINITRTGTKWFTSDIPATLRRMVSPKRLWLIDCIRQCERLGWIEVLVRFCALLQYVSPRRTTLWVNSPFWWRKRHNVP